MILQVARMLASNSSLLELGLSKHKLVDSQLETLVSAQCNAAVSVANGGRAGVRVTGRGRVGTRGTPSHNCRGFSERVGEALGVLGPACPPTPQVSYGLLRNKSLQSLDLRANRLSGFSGAAGN